ncbi:hypothetical protein AB0878_30135 [Amycolatopsis sp. NPDC047767]|uniref:hypothetical protein n=1 Tax=Amycolatopsis sp. NPDC047767 TaxID=3156765 RepID=UPI0034535123
MTILGFCEDDEYLPEYGTVVVRDVYREDRLPSLGNELLGELATNALSGTIATAGDGWLHGTVGDPAKRFAGKRTTSHPTYGSGTGKTSSRRRFTAARGSWTWER